MRRPFPMILAALAAGALLAGCAREPTARPTPATTTPADTAGTATTVNSASERARKRDAKATANTRSTVTTKLPERTGIVACDDYLASYVACHRAAQVYAPDQLQSRYQAMRTSLLRDSQNEATRPQLAARCTALATQLREVLRGKPCAPEPASASTQP